MYNMEIAFGTYKIRLEILLILIFLLWVTFGHALCSCCTMSLREGLETITGTGTADDNMDEEEKKKAAEAVSTISSSTSTTSPAIIMDDSTEPFANLTDVYGNDGKFNSIDMMDKMEFKPECCPSTYTNSHGCACITDDAYKYLTGRGGNNVPYSEY